MNGTNRNGILYGLHNGLDMIINLVAILIAYSAAAYFFEPSVGIGNVTIIFTFVILLISSFVYQLFDINRPVAFGSYVGSIMPIIKANILFF